MLVCTSSMESSYPLEGNPKAREEAEVGDWEDHTLRREILRRESRPKLETGRIGEHNDDV
jgi:hypothetical protein